VNATNMTDQGVIHGTEGQSLESRMLGNGAPRDAVLNPYRRQERFGGTPLGHPTNLKAKARGDKSMSEKRGPAEDAYVGALQGPRDTAKA
jgi:hypothetical protein